MAGAKNLLSDLDLIRSNGLRYIRFICFLFVRSFLSDDSLLFDFETIAFT